MSQKTERNIVGHQKDTPQYEHDCEVCIFLGINEVFGYDYYLYKSADEVTVIARYGSKGREYISGLALAGFNPIIREAIIREAINLAKTEGMLSDEEIELWSGGRNLAI